MFHPELTSSRTSVYALGASSKQGLLFVFRSTNQYKVIAVGLGSKRTWTRVSWRSLQPEPGQSESVSYWKVFKEQREMITLRVEPQCEQLTDANTDTIDKLALVRLPATPKAPPPFPQGRWVVEYFHSLNQVKTTQFGAFQDGYQAIQLSALETEQSWMEWWTDWRTDGWRTDGRTNGLMSVDFEKRSWQQLIGTDEYESNGQGKTALCCFLASTCLPAKEKMKEHKTQKFKCSRLVRLFLSHNFADIFFFFVIQR